MALTKVTSGAVSGLATSATTDTTDASNITTGTIPTARLDSTLDLSSKTVTLPAASVTAHATNPTKASIEALGIDLPAADLTGTIADARFPSTLPAISGANLTGIDAATVSATDPDSPAQGDMWFDTTAGTNSMKVWSGSGWDVMSNKFTATGGTESTYSSGGVNYKAHTFTSSGTFTAESSGTVDYLVIAGGGGGGSDHEVGGGGGAGGFLTGTTALSSQGYAISIGGGGTRGTGGDGGQAGGGSNGTAGGNSTFNSITSIGGGYGATRSTPTGGSGGSGGGSGDSNGAKSGGAGTSGQGYAGGTSGNMDSPNSNLDAGAGGGAGGSPSPNYYNPGAGKASSISGSSVTYAAGGGITGSGGFVQGAVNTGNGGSSCRDGGSGIVIIRYEV